MEISVIVPVYNTSKYLEKCIDSIVKQNFSDFELILVNDGSQDESASICKKYEDKYSFIKFLDFEHKGVSHARNKGFEESSGKYIVFIDSDDWIEYNMLKKSYDKAIETNADIVQCNLINVKESGTSFLSDSNNNREGLFESPAEIQYYYGSVIGKMIRRDVIESKKIRFYEDIYQGEDNTFMIRVFNNASLIYYITEILYYRQIRPESLIHSIDLNGYKNRLAGALRLKKEMRNKKVGPFLMEKIDKYLSACKDNVQKHSI